MCPWHQPRSPDEFTAGGSPTAAPAEQPAWQRPVRALLGMGAIDVGAALSPSIASAWSDLSEGQQIIVSAILSYLGLSPEVGATMVELQRQWLRAGAMRRSDGIETLTGLVCLLVGSPITSAAMVEDIHRSHHHLRQNHWWPSGPEDLPLAALLVAGSVDPNELIARMEELHLALSEGDEVPGDANALVVLTVCVPELSDLQVVQRLGALRTELLLSGLAVQDADIVALLTLAIIPAEPELVIKEFVVERRNQSPNGLGKSSQLAIALATDRVVLRYLNSSSRLRYIASLAIHAWLVHRHHQQKPSTQSIRRSL